MWPALLPVIGKLLDNLIPDPTAAAEAKLKAFEAAQRGELATLDADMRLALGQIEVNKAEAESGSMLRGGWRPACGWVCALGLFYTFLLQPLLPWIVALFGREVPALPALDIETLMVLLGGMLGLGGYRSFERVKGKA